MTHLQAFFLAFIQGLTEFLPISSSGHLAILQNLLGFRKPPVAFDILLHLGTLTAVVAFFWRDLKQANRSLLCALALGSVPTGIIGLLFEKKAEAMFMNFPLLGIGYTVTTLLLLSTLVVSRIKQGTKTKVDLISAFLIGIAQGIAVIPGISRSGATIITGLWLGIDRKEAARFSFLLSIPAIIGAQLLQTPKLLTNAEMTASVAGIGFFMALIVGWFSLRLLIAMVNGMQLHWFALYTGLLALIILLV